MFAGIIIVFENFAYDVATGIASLMLVSLYQRFKKSEISKHLSLFSSKRQIPKGLPSLQIVGRPHTILTLYDISNNELNI